MAFTHKDWFDAPSENTPISAAALEDLEDRLAAYADSVAGTSPNAVPKSLYAANGTMVTGGLTAANPVAIPLGPNGTRPKVNTLTPGGFTFDYGMQVYNVKDYPGVTGAAGTDNQGAGINTCLAAAAGNGIAYFPPGTYMINPAVPIEVPSNSHLLGAGAGLSVLKAMPIAGGSQIIRNINHNTVVFSSITLEGLEIDGNRTNRASGAPMVAFKGIEASGARSSAFRLLDCYLHDAPGFSLICNTTDNVQILGNRVYNGGRDGLSCGPGINRITVANNQIRDVDDDGIAVGGRQTVYGTTNVVIANNVINAAGIGPSGGHGIALSGTTGAVVSGNMIDRGEYAGIMLRNGGDGQCKRIAITGNSIQNTGSGFAAGSADGDGIRVAVSASGGYSENFPFVVPPDDGHQAYVGSLVIAGNVIANGHSHGMKFEGTSTNPIRDVDIRDNRLLGLLASDGTPYGVASGIHAPFGAQQFNVSGNAINSFTGRGIYVGNSQTTPADWTMANNQIRACGRGATEHKGIQLVAMAGGMVMGNRVTDAGAGSQTHGFDWGGSTSVFVANNDFSGNTSAGTTGTIGAGCMQSMNRRQDGTLMEGNATPGLL